MKQYLILTKQETKSLKTNGYVFITRGKTSMRIDDDLHIEYLNTNIKPLLTQDLPNSITLNKQETTNLLNKGEISIFRGGYIYAIWWDDSTQDYVVRVLPINKYDEVVTR